MNRVTMAGAVVRDPGGRLFVHRRAPGRRLFPSCWDIVGGSVEEGETVHETLAREMLEETGWVLEGVISLVSEQEWSTATDRETEQVYLVTADIGNGEPSLEDGKFVDYRWLTGPEEARAVLAENRDRSGSDYIADIIERCWHLPAAGGRD